MRPLRVAVLDEELPFPATSGKRIRSFNLLSRLADRHRVTVLCHRNPDRGHAISSSDRAGGGASAAASFKKVVSS